MNTLSTYPDPTRWVPGHAAPWRTPARWNGKPRLLVLEVHPRTTPNAAPVAHLLIEREEQYEYDDNGKVSKAIIRIWYERLEPARLFSDEPRRNLCFEGSYHAWRAAHGCVSLTSTSLGHGAVYLDLDSLEGHRIGTYLMNEVVSWAQQWPEAEVHPVELLATQSIDAANKFRRNRFYTQFGLCFDFRDTEGRAGMSAPITVARLNTVETWRLNIHEQPLDDALRDALAAAQDADLRFATLAAEHNRYVATHTDRRLRWRRVLLVAFVAFVLAVLATSAVLHRLTLA